MIQLKVMCHDMSVSAFFYLAYGLVEHLNKLCCLGRGVDDEGDDKQQNGLCWCYFVVGVSPVT